MSICQKIAATVLAEYFPVVEADLAEATAGGSPRWRRRPEAPKNEPGARVPPNLFANSPTALAHSPSIFDLLYAARGMPAEEEAMTPVITQEDASAINWYRELTPVEKRTFWACFGGWALDAMDVQIFSFVIPAIIIAFAITNADAGLIGTVTLLTSAFGGWFAGALADRFGRVRTLQITILWFAFFTLLCGFA